MKYAVVLIPDTESINRICSISKLIYKDNFSEYLFKPPLVPHITLSVFSNIPSGEIIDKLNIFCKNICRIKLILAQIGLFPTDENAIFLAPVMTKELFNIHILLNEMFSDYKSFIDAHYLPGSWVPHCTLGLNIMDLANAVEIVKSKFTSFEMTIEKLSLIEFYPVKEMKTYTLGNLKNETTI